MQSEPATSDLPLPLTIGLLRVLPTWWGENRPPREVLWVAMTHWQHPLLDSSGLIAILGRKWGQHTFSLCSWKPPLSLDLARIQKPPPTAEPTVALRLSCLALRSSGTLRALHHHLALCLFSF